MIITENTGANKDTHPFCKCGNDYGGDRIIIEDDIFIPILDGERQCGLDISGFFKNVSQANILKFKLNKGQTKVLTSPDDNGMKFLAISTEKPTTPLYWRKKYESILDEYITAILNGSFVITTAPFTQDRINATLDLTLKSDNSFKYITWANFEDAYINGSFGSSWNAATASWVSYDPSLTTNRKVVVDKALSIPFVIEQDQNGNYTGEITEIIDLGNAAITFKLEFHGEYPNTFVIDSLTLSLDGHFVGALFVNPGTLTTDFVTIPLCMRAEYSFLATSGKVEVYDKIVGLMVLTSTDNEPIQPIKLLNNNDNQIKVSAMIGS